MAVTESRTVDDAGASAPRAGRSVPVRFGLRTLFVFAVLSCVFFAWIGRNLYEARQDEAAIEALKRADATYEPKSGEEADGVGERRFSSLVRQALGLQTRPPLRMVGLHYRSASEQQLSAAVVALERFPDTHAVWLVGPAFDDRSCDTLAKLTGVEDILLFRTACTDAGIARLSSLDRLHRLRLLDCDAVEDFAALSTLTSLESLALTDMRLSRSDVAAVVALPNLQELLLARNDIADEETFSLLASAPTLRTLSVDENRFFYGDDAELDVAIALQLPRLERLAIRLLRDDDLARLASHPRLRSLELEGDLSDEALLDFSRSAPECVVRFEASHLCRYFHGGREISYEEGTKIFWHEPKAPEEGVP